MLERGISEAHVRATCYENALAAYSQSVQFDAQDWLNPSPRDQRRLFQGNSVLRGQEPVVENSQEYALIE